MGCLYIKQDNQKAQTPSKSYQNQEMETKKKKDFNNQPTGIYESIQKNSQQQHADVTLLYTDSSSDDDQEIYQIDQFIKFRRNQLIKRKIYNSVRRHKSWSKFNEKQITKRSLSLGQKSESFISINFLYYEKFLSFNKVQQQSQIQQIDLQKLDIEIQNQIIQQKMNEDDLSLESSFSSLKQLTTQCQNCKKEIQNDQFQLECLHIFDIECLLELIINQIEKNQTQIFCLCHQSIKTNLVKQILQERVEKSKEYIEKLFVNQSKKLVSISNEI